MNYSKQLYLFSIKDVRVKVYLRLLILNKLFGTQNTNTDSTLWTCRFLCEEFGTQRFGGTIERVSELVGIYLINLSKKIIESCIANKNEWFKDNIVLHDQINEVYDSLIIMET